MNPLREYKSRLLEVLKNTGQILKSDIEECYECTLSNTTALQIEERIILELDIYFLRTGVMYETFDEFCWACERGEVKKDKLKDFKELNKAFEDHNFNV